MMITARPSCSWHSSQPKRGFTLIEIVGVLAVVAILSALVLPALTKQVDSAVADQESRTLQAFSDAFQRAVLRRSYIPGPGGLDWATTIANELALDSSEVVTNRRHQRRFFLIDPKLSIAGGGLPYAQTTGAIARAVSPRIMLLSTLGAAFPAGMKDAPDPDFDSIWKTPERSVPTGVASLSGWSGNGDDLKIQRIDLSPLFVQLTLASMGSTVNTTYSINDPTNSVSLPPGSSMNFYYLQNSVLALYTNPPPNLDSKQILVRDSFFVYYANQWRSTIPGGLSAIADAFLATQAVVPTNQAPVVGSFISYFTNYVAWAGTGFSTNNGGAVTAYLTMSNQLAAFRLAFP